MVLLFDSLPYARLSYLKYPVDNDDLAQIVIHNHLVILAVPTEWSLIQPGTSSNHHVFFLQATNTTHIYYILLALYCTEA